jgi:hypothetical protein
MAATLSLENMFARRKVWTVEVDDSGASTDPIIVDLGQPQGAGLLLIPIARLLRFGAILFKSVGTGNTDAFNIFAATNAAGTGSATTVVSVATATAQTQNALGDQLVLECSVEQIREVLPTATHVGVRVELATGTDEMIVTAIAEYVDETSGLTANYIS